MDPARIRKYRKEQPPIDRKYVNDQVLVASKPLSSHLTPRAIVALTGVVFLLSSLGVYHLRVPIVMESDENDIDDKPSLLLSVIAGFGISALAMGGLLTARYIFDKKSKTLQ